ncbi:MAG: lamin tail domain-containing protein [Bacteroidales bacterium]|nr:lamin tail domain-containing protein [Bacteroidales bacterium]
MKNNIKKIIFLIYCFGILGIVYPQQASDLFISEYIDWSSNQALEIFNGTGKPVNLSQYSIQLTENYETFEKTYNLSGTLNSGEVYVITWSNSCQDILNEADLIITHTITNIRWDGNDMIRLIKNGTVVDWFGFFDEGTCTENQYFAASCIFIRKAIINTPRNTPQDPNTNNEWNEYSGTDYSHIGNHNFAFGNFIVEIGNTYEETSANPIDVPYLFDGFIVEGNGTQGGTANIQSLRMIKLLPGFHAKEGSNVIVTNIIPEPLQVVGTVDNNNGTIVLQVSDGLPPYYYLWSNGSTAQNQTGLEYGTYSVTVSDAMGNQVNKTFDIYTNELNINTDYNYSITTTPFVEVTSESSLENLEFNNKQVSVKYLDGFGRPIQNIAVKASPKMYDMIQHVEYDEFGRQTKSYLPFTKNNNANFIDDPFAELNEFYSGQEKVSETDYYYAETVFDNSPLNRVTEQGAPGETWQVIDGDPEAGHTVKLEHCFNSVSEVKKLYLDGNSCYVDGYHTENTLSVSETTDENNARVKTYKNSLGKTVLKRVFNDCMFTIHNTYYVYDDFNLLRYIIPPAAIVNNGIFSDSDYSYYFEYDERHRMIYKKVPGADIVYMVYDILNRPVLTQDGNQRINNEWSFIKYDRSNRPILTGIYVNADNLQTIQQLVNTYTGDNLFEIRGTDVHNYTNRTFPNVLNENNYLTVVYYDDYNFNYSSYLDFDNSKSIDTYIDNDAIDNGYFDRVNGLVTGQKVKILDGSDTWLCSMIYYDNKYRPIQSVSENHLSGLDIVSNRYDFISKLKRTEHFQTVIKDTETLEATVKNSFIYDHAGRLLQIYQQINDEQEVALNDLHYNELGQVIEKNLHSYNHGTTSLQSVDYEYNIRGMLTKINNADLSSSDDNDLFGMEFFYDKTIDNLGNSADIQYNGNITAMKWATAHNSDGYTGERAYAFQYDDINQLKSARYGQETSGIWSPMNKYSIPDISYDKNGNILELERYGVTGSLIDDLDYLYNGNQLNKVTDYSSTTGGFNDGTNTDDDYLYDSNGNMIRDKNKGVENIFYNYLNLPIEVDFGNNNFIQYIYTANGVKIRKEVYQSNNLISSNDYINGFVYNINELEFIQTAEGRVVPEANNINFRYEYSLTDHLGNTRVCFTDLNNDGQADLIQENHYYPFGLTMDGLNYYGSGIVENKYKFNGKEMQDEYGLNLYDFGWRMYNPALGRWHNIDPALQHASPYLALGNNPINRIDPNGLYDDWVVQMCKAYVNHDNITESYYELGMYGGGGGGGRGGGGGGYGGSGTSGTRGGIWTDAERELIRQVGLLMFLKLQYYEWVDEVMYGDDDEMITAEALGEAAMAHHMDLRNATVSLVGGELSDDVMFTTTYDGDGNLTSAYFGQVQKRGVHSEIENKINQAGISERERNIANRDGYFDPDYEEQLYINQDLNVKVADALSFISSNISIGNENLSGTILYDPAGNAQANFVTQIGWKDTYTKINRQGGAPINGYLVRFVNSNGYSISTLIFKNHKNFKRYTNYLLGN